MRTGMHLHKPRGKEWLREEDGAGEAPPRRVEALLPHGPLPAHEALDVHVELEEAHGPQDRPLRRFLHPLVKRHTWVVIWGISD